jgi:hypothetical protein
MQSERTSLMSLRNILHSSSWLNRKTVSSTKQAAMLGLLLHPEDGNKMFVCNASGF